MTVSDHEITRLAIRSIWVDSVGSDGILTQTQATAGYQPLDADLTTLSTLTAWRGLYSDGSGNVAQQAFGASGLVWKSNGVGAVPTWQSDATGGGGSATADSMAHDWGALPTDFDDIFPSSANELLIDTLGVVSANSDFYLLARGIGDILLQDSVNISGLVTLSNLTALRLVATDASKNLVSTITGANLNSGISDANAVFEARTITVAGTSNEITSSAGAQDLSANRTWTLSLPTRIEADSLYAADSTNLVIGVSAVGDILLIDSTTVTGLLTVSGNLFRLSLL